MIRAWLNSNFGRANQCISASNHIPISLLEDEESAAGRLDQLNTTVQSTDCENIN